MDGSDAPTLEVGFAINFGDAIGQLRSLDDIVAQTSAAVFREAQKMERSLGGGFGLTGTTAQVTTFGNAVSAQMQSIARETAKTEKTAEGLILSLERQNETFGKSRAELQAIRVETAAYAAEQKGLTEVAGRLRAEYAILTGAQAAAVEQQQAEATAMRQATLAHAMFEAKVREGVAALKEEEAASRAAAVAIDAQAKREAALAVAMFEARAKQGMQAYAAEQAIEAAAAVDREAQAIRSASLAYQMFNAVAKQKMGAYNDQQAAALEREAVAARNAAEQHARLAAMVQGSNAAQEADAAAAERLRESTDAVYAATKRVNAEIAESTRLYHAGATAPAEYARQQQVLNTRLMEETGALAGSTRGHQVHAGAAGLSRNAQMELTHVIKASAEQMAMGAPPLQILTTHLGQLGQIATMTEGGVWGLTKALGGMLLTIAPIAAPLAVVAGIAFAAFKQFQGQVKDSGELTRYRDSLGLTHKEMLQLSDGVDKAGGKIEHLTDVTVTAGDVMAGLWQAIKDDASKGIGSGAWDTIKTDAAAAFRWVLEAWNVTSAGITAGIYGTVNAAKVIWANFASSVGDVFYQAVNIAIGAMNKLVQAGTVILNGFVHAANKVTGATIGDFKPSTMADVSNPYAGKASQAAADAAFKAVKGGFTNSYDVARKVDDDFWKRVGVNAKQSYKDRAKEQADALKENRTPKAPKVDHNALNTEAVEAQIKNLYKLADAYGVSDAAALIAEAREKAESKAIKARADVEAAVAQQIRLAVAQRVAEGAKATAALNHQAAAQEMVNSQVAAGITPAAQAAQVMQDRMALLPLLAAQEAARLGKDSIGYAAATKQIAELTGAQQRDNAAKREAQFLSDQAAGGNQLAQLRLEADLIGATDQARTHALATLKATQEAEAKFTDPAQQAAYIARQVEIADKTLSNTQANDAYNESLSATADRWDIIAGKVQSAGQGMADAFGSAGKAIGDLTSTYASYEAQRARLATEHDAQIKHFAGNQAALDRENQMYALRSSGQQVAAYGDMVGAAKGFFKEGTAGYDALAAAEKVYRAAQFAMSLAAMVQNALETAGVVTGAAAKATAEGAVGVAKQSQLPFPLNLAAMAATAAALVAAGIAVIGGSGGGGHVDLGNTGTGTVLGNSTAGSDSIKNSIDALKNVDMLMLTSSRSMQASLKSIDSQIGSFAAQIVKGGEINASSNIATGFQTNAIGSILSKIPLVGGILGSLFGTRTDITGSGLYGKSQTIGDINASGYSGQSYSDVEKTKKFLGIVTGRSYSTQYGSLDPSVNSQFTLILKSFDQAIAAAAGPLADATDAVQAKLDGFVVNIGKIDLQGLSGDEIQKKLENVFGALGDQMATYVYPEIAQFQKVGEGALETLVRVASTVESVTSGLDELGLSTKALGIDAKIGIASQFDSISDLTSATDAYLQAFYTSAEQTAAKTAQMAKVFDSLGVAVPTTLASFRQLVEAQDLTSAAGQATYATLLQLAPAFADLQSSMTGAKSAADILSERTDLQRQLLELQGNTAAVRALDLAKVDTSNQALQQQVWAVQDAQDAAKAAADLADAWKSVGDSILDEINRIRGLNDPTGDGSFAALLGQFNAANTAARAGDQTAAKTLPQLSQALLTAAAAAATSRQELDRVQAQTAASLQTTYDAISGIVAQPTATAATSNAALLAAAATAQASTSGGSADSDDQAAEIRDLKAEIVQLHADLKAGLATIAGNTGKSAKILDAVTAPSGGQAVAVANAA